MELSRDEILEKKRELRRRLREMRAALSREWIDAASRRVLTSLRSFPPYQAAQTVMCYVSLPQEVQTHELLKEMHWQGKTVVIPWCHGEELRLFRFRGFDELTPGTLGILEPAPVFRTQPERLATPGELDLVLVPGLGFDRKGGRLGQGKGYYDRFLKTISPDVPKVGLAFEWQIVEEIPLLAHDIRMDWIITENNIYFCRE